MIFSNRLMADIDFKCECSMRKLMNMYRVKNAFHGETFPMISMTQDGFCCIVFKPDYDTVCQLQNLMES